MSRPDLDTPEGRAAYRQELKRVAGPWRYTGLTLIVLAGLTVLAVRYQWFPLPEQVLYVAYGMLALGWALWIVAIFLRTRHHKRRLMEGL